MFHRPKPTKARSSGGGFVRSHPPPASRSFSKGSESSMFLEGINSSANSSMMMSHANSSFRKTSRKPQTTGIKRLAKEASLLQGMLPALSVSRIGKFFPNRSNSVVQGNVGVSLESDDDIEAVKDCFVADLPPSRVEKGRMAYSRKIAKREFIPSRTANGSFDAVPSPQSSAVELSVTKLDLYPNLQTILRDLPSEDAHLGFESRALESRGLESRGFESRGLDSRGQTRGRETYNQMIISRTNSMQSKRATTPGTVAEQSSSNLRTIVRSRENSAGKDETLHQPEFSLTAQGFKILGPADSRSGRWNYESIGSSPLSNINSLLDDKAYLLDDKAYLKPQKPVKIVKRRERVSERELRFDHKENFMKLIYKGIGRNLQNHQLGEDFLLDMERSRITFKKKMTTMKNLI